MLEAIVILMLTHSDRGWMYKRKEDGYLCETYKESVEHFLDVAFSNEAIVDKNCIKCPCSKCKNLPYKTRDDVKLHLQQYGFIPNYTIWWAHGETTTVHHEVQSPNPMEDDDFDGCSRMVMDAVGSADEMNLDADEPLWEGCQKISKLQAASELLNWKSDFNISEAAYNHVLMMIKRMLPPSEKLVGNFYETKKILKKIRLPDKKIHACKNHCMLYYGNDSNLTHCRVCGHDRYKSDRLSLVPCLVMRYLPIAPRLERLYATKNTAKQMTWHFDHRTEPGFMSHPRDGQAWKHFDSMHPEFACDPRNIRLELCTDGFSPNNSNSSPYSSWPVFLSIYNLLPWMCLKEVYVQLSMIIPGKKSSGQNLDVFLRPLIDELKMLYNDGVAVYDASRRENFNMRAMLLWTVSDFPAYAMLSGWSTHGKLACPYCMDKLGSFTLKHGGKATWFDCHGT
ncbi:hypothetical protein LXL04_016836 [Taraxacum kok-saghyz]